MDSSTVKFYILALHTFQLLASTSFGLCENADRARITPSLGRYKHLRLLQVDATSPENSFPYGIYTSPPPPPLSGAVSPISPQINSPPVGMSTPPPATSVPPSPQINPPPVGISTPPPATSVPPSPQINSPPVGIYSPPPSKSVPPSPRNSSSYGTFNPPLTPSGAMPTPLLPTSPPPPSPSAQTPQHNAPKPPPNNSHSSSPPPPPPAARPNKPENAVWCVAKPTVPADLIQQALDYACGSGAGCDAIQPNGACYKPTTLLSHASYAFNSYWQKKKQGGGTCDFGGTAMLVTVDPSYDQCRFTYS